MVNPFFKNTGPHNINYLLKAINLKSDGLIDDEIKDIKAKNGIMTRATMFLEISKVWKNSINIQLVFHKQITNIKYLKKLFIRRFFTLKTFFPYK